MSGGSPPPTSGSSSTSRDTRSPCTARSRGSRRGATGISKEFLDFWQANAHTRLIWISLYTPQVGELSMERLTAGDRAKVIGDMRRPASQVFEVPDVRRHARRLRRSRPSRRRTASSRRPRSASRRISSTGLRPVSSEENRTAKTAAASPRPVSKRSGVIVSVAVFLSGRSFTHRSRLARRSSESAARSPPPDSRPLPWRGCRRTHFCLRCRSLRLLT